MSDREGILLTREQLESWSGGPLTDDDLERLEDAIPNSSIPEAVSTIVDGMGRDELWPPEGRPEFVKRLGEQRWTPLCRCGYDLRLPEGNVQTWECSYAPVTHPRVMLWAEDWPDYTED